MPVQAKKHLGMALMIACTVFVAMCFSSVFHSEVRPAKLQALVMEERAEMTLRMSTMLNVGIAKLSEQFQPIVDKKGNKQTPLEVSSAGLGPMVKTARTSLDQAIKLNPDSGTLRAKEAVLFYVSGGKKKHIEELCSWLGTSKQLSDRKLGAVLRHALISKDPLPNQILIQAPVKEAAIANDTEKSSKPESPAASQSKTNSQYEAVEEQGKSQNFSEQNAQLKAEPQSVTITPADAVSIIEAGIPKGWYQEQAKLAYFKSAKLKKDYAALSKSLEDRYLITGRTMLIAYSFGAICCLIGVIVIIVQFGSLGRKDPANLPEPERVGLDMDFRTIYSVFVGWLTCEFAISHLFKMLPTNMLKLGGSPIGISAFSMISYLITMIPALLLIYHIALKPKGLSFFNAMKIRKRTATAGPVKLIFAGIFSWMAIIPLVLLSSIVASSMLGSQGSDNPVLAQISIVANSKNFLAIGMLYFTIACLAPFFEEIVFRGFLYASLKTKWGIFPALLISSLVFAGIHFDKGGALMLAALAPVLAVSFERNRSLIPSMIAHGLWNGGSFAMAVTLYSS